MNTDNIVQVDFPKKEYAQGVYRKIMIVLHHTVSPGHDVFGDVAWWIKQKGRIATPIIINNKGVLYQLFRSKYWAHHIGLKHRNNSYLNKASIGVELDSLGPLKERGGVWRSVYGHIVKEENIQFYPNGYRGFEAFEKYTDKQIEALRELLEYWKRFYPYIDFKYKGDRIFDVCEDAIEGTPGIWSHTSFRKDKSDIHPQPEIIKMLKTL